MGTLKITYTDAIGMLRLSGDSAISIGERNITISFGRKIRLIDFQDSIGSLVFKSDVEKICNELRVHCQD